MTKLQKYNALLMRAWAFGATGITLGAIAIVFATVVGTMSKAALAVLPAAVIWTAAAFVIAAIPLCLAGVRYKIASVKLMREIVDEGKN